MVPRGYAAVRQYRESGVTSMLTDASPHRLIAMLYDGALERLALALSGIAHGNLADKLRGIDSTQAILGHLHDILDYKAGGDIAMRLAALYDYMMRRLIHAKLHNDAAAVQEVIGLLRTIKAGWDAIAPQVG
ncbi:MAG: flagellar export chaperone FliS [Nevskia sp.]|nr:flagellar export chaperone FliS [Nevskia sp.]